MVLLIGSIDKGLIGMSKRTYNWIQGDVTYIFIRLCKARHYKEVKSRYFVLKIYGVQAARGLHIHSPHGQTSHHVFSHREKIEINRVLLYELHQALDVITTK